MRFYLRYGRPLLCEKKVRNQEWKSYEMPAWRRWPSGSTSASLEDLHSAVPNLNLKKLIIKANVSALLSSITCEKSGENIRGQSQNTKGSSELNIICKR